MTHDARLRGLRARFLADVPARIARIEALLGSDRDAARREAHNLKGTAASLELAIHAHAEALERALATGADDRVVKQLLTVIRGSVAP